MAPELDIAERLPVWTILSELFLDTSFDDADFDRIATALKQSPYRPAELECILREEVSPAFAGNLWSVAGEWTPWSEDEVREIMARHAKKGWAARLIQRFVMKTVPSEWEQIACRLA